MSCLCCRHRTSSVGETRTSRSSQSRAAAGPPGVTATAGPPALAAGGERGREGDPRPWSTARSASCAATTSTSLKRSSFSWRSMLAYSWRSSGSPGSRRAARPPAAPGSAFTAAARAPAGPIAPVGAPAPAPGPAAIRFVGELGTEPAPGNTPGAAANAAGKPPVPAADGLATPARPAAAASRRARLVGELGAESVPWASPYCMICSRSTFPETFLQSMQPQRLEHSMPAWKHSQYFFRQYDLRQLQPLACLVIGLSVGSATSAATLGRNAFALRSSTARMAAVRRSSVAARFRQSWQLQCGSQ